MTSPFAGTPSFCTLHPTSCQPLVYKVANPFHGPSNCLASVWDRGLDTQSVRSRVFQLLCMGCDLYPNATYEAVSFVAHTLRKGQNAGPHHQLFTQNKSSANLNYTLSISSSLVYSLPAYTAPSVSFLKSWRWCDFGTTRYFTPPWLTTVLLSGSEPTPCQLYVFPVWCAFISSHRRQFREPHRREARRPCPRCAPLKFLCVTVRAAAILRARHRHSGDFLEHVVVNGCTAALPAPPEGPPPRPFSLRRRCVLEESGDRSSKPTP